MPLNFSETLKTRIHQLLTCDHPVCLKTDIAFVKISRSKLEIKWVTGFCNNFVRNGILVCYHHANSSRVFISRECMNLVLVGIKRIVRRKCDRRRKGIIN